MTTEPDQIRARIDALLAPIPQVDADGSAPIDADLDDVAHRLSEAHDVLVRALESVEKG